MPDLTFQKKGSSGEGRFAGGLLIADQYKIAQFLATRSKFPASIEGFDGMVKTKRVKKLIERGVGDCGKKMAIFFKSLHCGLSNAGKGIIHSNICIVYILEKYV